MKTPKTAAARKAEQFGGYARPAPYDADAEALREEFARYDLTEVERADLAEALRLRLGTNAEQIAARAILVRLRQELDQAVKATLDHARGQKLKIAKNGKNSDAFRIIDRDGLGALHLAGKITAAQLGGGLAFRKRYELAERGLRSALGSEGTSKTPTPEERVRQAARLARFDLERKEVEDLVVGQFGERALILLRRIAGEGVSFAAAVDVPREPLTETQAAKRKKAGEAARTRALALLVAALDVCADRLPL